jgi:hypothetical protein
MEKANIMNEIINCLAAETAGVFRICPRAVCYERKFIELGSIPMVNREAQQVAGY